jgi:hypothetical protein
MIWLRIQSIPIYYVVEPTNHIMPPVSIKGKRGSR